MGNTLFHQCGHRQISSSEAKNTCWLKPGSPAHLALDEVVLNTKLLKDLAKLTDFCHTGNIEVYHSMMLNTAQNKNIFRTKEWLPGHNLQPWTTMAMLKDHKLWCSQANMLVKKGARFAFQRLTNIGL